MKLHSLIQYGHGPLRQILRLPLEGRHPCSLVITHLEVLQVPARARQSPLAHLSRCLLVTCGGSVLLPLGIGHILDEIPVYFFGVLGVMVRLKRAGLQTLLLQNLPIVLAPLRRIIHVLCDIKSLTFNLSIHILPVILRNPKLLLVDLQATFLGRKFSRRSNGTHVH